MSAADDRGGGRVAAMGCIRRAGWVSCVGKGSAVLCESATLGNGMRGGIAMFAGSRGRGCLCWLRRRRCSRECYSSLLSSLDDSTGIGVAPASAGAKEADSAPTKVARKFFSALWKLTTWAASWPITHAS